MNIPAKIESNVAALREVASAVTELTDFDSLRDVRARIQAAKAWAKAHGQIKSVRLDLLRVEIKILQQMVRAGHTESMPSRERATATFYAESTDDEIESFLQEHDNATTAVGLHQIVTRVERLERDRANALARGRQEARYPSRPQEDEDIEQARDYRINISASLSEMVERMEDVETFSVSEMADEILSSVSSDRRDEPAFRRGFEEVCREAIRRAPALHLAGTKLPRFVTARVGNGKYMRIPTQSARLWHLDDMRAQRREQLDQDRAALDRLDQIADQLRRIPTAHSESQIGELVAQSLITSKEA